MKFLIRAGFCVTFTLVITGKSILAGLAVLILVRIAKLIGFGIQNGIQHFFNRPTDDIIQVVLNLPRVNYYHII